MPGLDVLMGIGVSAAGTVAGGAAAQGLSDMMGGGEGGAGTGTAQNDPKEALKWFEKAAQTNESYIKEGLGLYNRNIIMAVDEVKKHLSQANNQLIDTALKGTAASDQYIRMLGIDAPSVTRGISKVFTDEFGDKGAWGGVRDQINMAEKIKDPAKRAEAKQGILASLSTEQAKLNDQRTALQNQVTALGKRPDFTGDPGYEKAKAMYAQASEEFAKASASLTTSKMDKRQRQAALSAYANNLQQTSAVFQMYEDAQQQERIAWDTKWLQYNDQMSKIEPEVERIQTFADTYNNAYSNEGNFGYTGEQIRKQLESTPGYGFQLQQGTQAVQRTAAAKGLLGSGNTLLGVQQFGQDLAQNTYNNYMNSLGNVANAGNVANQQISSNLMSAGSGIAGLWQGTAAAALNAYSAIGQGYYGAYMESGKTVYDSSKSNAQATNETAAQLREIAARQQQNQAQLGAQYAQLGYGMLQNQNYGAGYSGQGGGGGGGYI